MSIHGDQAAQWDVFVSYSRADVQQAGVLAAALREQGLRVFVDETSVEDFASITTTITGALARSKSLLAFYSARYPHSRACQWELTYAYLAGQREGDPRKRVLVVNPDAGAGHVQPVELRDARHWPWPSTPSALGRFAARVAAHTAELVDAMSAPRAYPDGRAAPGSWLPAPARTGSSHFTGRLREQWHIHTALHRHHTPLVAPSSGGSGRTAQLRGMAGIGKSLLAQEYALRFGSAFPGGVFWFDLHGLQGAEPSAVMDAYAEQVATVTDALGLGSGGPERQLRQSLSRLAVFLGEQGSPCLWTVDGLPDGLSEEHLNLLRGPHLLASTLITTRSRRYGGFAEPVDLGPLPDADSLQLLTARHTPRGEAEQAAAAALVHDVGGHPQALGILRELAAAGFTRTRNRLHAPGPDILAGELTGTLLPDPLAGRAPTADILRLLAVACPAPLSSKTLETALGTVPPYDPWETASLTAHTLDALLGTGALTPSPAHDGTWTVHPLLARTVRRHDEDIARQEDLRRALLHALTEPAAPSPVPVAQALEAGSRGLWRNGPSEPGPQERSAAFDLQVELVTRVGVQPLPAEEGSLREALTSLHTLFASARAALHQIAAQTESPGALPLVISHLVNDQLRPFLTTWHTALRRHEAARPADVGAFEHEQNWPRATEMRIALDKLRTPLVSAAHELGHICGVDLLDGSRRP
ncbi:tetratricopeptide repeat protein [Streptomyces triticagri]|uniref:tetratricopeptide repeat protein n=1 Tax=Streptomyces triticagri TaxID=2293568 RepID=UPI001F2C58F8|nr:toll/interleukin-1 receptor domain-containing protein [Streptomyces triticagri]